MSDLRELYQDVILDHGKKPRNFRVLEGADRHAHGKNPLCGDDFEIMLNLDANDVITDIAFEGKGCAISVASASIMTELLKGRSKADAEALFQNFHQLCTEDSPVSTALAEDDRAYLEVLAGVKQFPIRVKCATLPWHTVRAALAGEKNASTEKTPIGQK
jgi:nitrogen fixation NifU-like protein